MLVDDKNNSFNNIQFCMRHFVYIITFTDFHWKMERVNLTDKMFIKKNNMKMLGMCDIFPI